jgi:hypothetical protein
LGVNTQNIATFHGYMPRCSGTTCGICRTKIENGINASSSLIPNYLAPGEGAAVDRYASFACQWLWMSAPTIALYDDLITFNLVSLRASMVLGAKRDFFVLAGAW